jgi:hypothetical protein
MAMAATRTVPGGRRRWPRRILRRTLWAGMGLLALVAVAALVTWPWSYAHPGTLDGECWAVGGARVDRVAVAVGWGDGRVGIRYDREVHTQGWFNYGRGQAASNGPGWRWDRFEGQEYWSDLDGDRSWGPVRWRSAVDESRPEQDPEALEMIGSALGAGRTDIRRAASLPCWLLALAAGAWPAGSATLWARRRRRLRRLAREECCRRCGYDCRATPDPAGPRLAACPECGEIQG